MMLKGHKYYDLFIFPGPLVWYLQSSDGHWPYVPVNFSLTVMKSRVLQLLCLCSGHSTRKDSMSTKQKPTHPLGQWLKLPWSPLSLLGTLTACICDTHVTLMWPHTVSICVPVSAPLHKFTDWQGVGEREGSCSDLAASQHGLGLCQTRKRCPVSAQ